MKKNCTNNQEIWYLLKEITRISLDEIAADVVVPPDSPWFCGHFPGDPVLPGIAQLGIIFDIIKYLKHVRLISMKRVRFKKIIRPDDILNIALSTVPMPERGDEDRKKEKILSCSFKIMVKEEIACSGTFIIEEKIKNEGRQ